MSEAFVICNQLGQFWGKKKRWVDGTKPRKVLVCKHADEGLNVVVELSAKDIDLRGEIVPVSLNERGIPEVEPSQHLIEDADDLETFADDPNSKDEAETAAELDDTASVAPVPAAEEPINNQNG